MKFWCVLVLAHFTVASAGGDADECVTIQEGDCKERLIAKELKKVCHHRCDETIVPKHKCCAGEGFIFMNECELERYECENSILCDEWSWGKCGDVLKLRYPQGPKDRKNNALIDEAGGSSNKVTSVAETLPPMGNQAAGSKITPSGIENQTSSTQRNKATIVDKPTGKALLSTDVASETEEPVIVGGDMSDLKHTTTQTDDDHVEDKTITGKLEDSDVPVSTVEGEQSTIIVDTGSVSSEERSTTEVGDNTASSDELSKYHTLLPEDATGFGNGGETTISNTILTSNNEKLHVEITSLPQETTEGLGAGYDVSTIPNDSNISTFEKTSVDMMGKSEEDKVVSEDIPENDTENIKEISEEEGDTISLSSDDNESPSEVTAGSYENEEDTETSTIRFDTSPDEVNDGDTVLPFEETTEGLEDTTTIRNKDSRRLELKEIVAFLTPVATASSDDNTPTSTGNTLLPEYTTGRLPDNPTYGDITAATEMLPQYNTDLQSQRTTKTLGIHDRITTIRNDHTISSQPDEPFNDSQFSLSDNITDLSPDGPTERLEVVEGTTTIRDEETDTVSQDNEESQTEETSGGEEDDKDISESGNGTDTSSDEISGNNNQVSAVDTTEGLKDTSTKMYVSTDVLFYTLAGKKTESSFEKVTGGQGNVDYMYNSIPVEYYPTTSHKSSDDKFLTSQEMTEAGLNTTILQDSTGRADGDVDTTTDDEKKSARPTENISEADDSVNDDGIDVKSTIHGIDSITNEKITTETLAANDGKADTTTSASKLISEITSPEFGTVFARVTMSQHSDINKTEGSDTKPKRLCLSSCPHKGNQVCSLSDGTLISFQNLCFLDKHNCNHNEGAIPLYVGGCVPDTKIVDTKTGCLRTLGDPMEPNNQVCADCAMAGNRTFYSKCALETYLNRTDDTCIIKPKYFCPDYKPTRLYSSDCPKCSARDMRKQPLCAHCNKGSLSLNNMCELMMRTCVESLRCDYIHEGLCEL